MKLKTLIGAAVAAAFVLPLGAQGAGDKASSGSSNSMSSGAKAAQSRPVGTSSSTEPTFKSLDRNNDGFISKDESKSMPHDKDFAKLDKNHDGKLSRSEYAATEHTSSSGSWNRSSNTSSKMSGGNVSSGK